MKRNISIFASAVILAGFLYLECKPVEIFHSSVFSTSNETEICLYVIVNSYLPIDRQELADEIIKKHREVNGVRENETYELHLYRTELHQRRNWKYDTLFCGPDGEIFQNETY